MAEEDAAKLNEQISSHTIVLLKIWALHLVKSTNGHPKYVNRLVVNFQPSMTPLYLQYLLDMDYSAIEAEDLPESNAKLFKKYFDDLARRKDKTYIVDQDSVDKISKIAPENSIFLVQMRDVDVSMTEEKTILEQFVLKNMRSSNCMVVFMKPIYGLRQQSVEERYGCKIRHIVLPLLDKPVKGYPDMYEKKWPLCERFPAVAESVVNPMNRTSIPDLITEHMALWKKPEFQPFYGYFYTLSGLAQAGTQLYTNTHLAPNMTMLDAAIILGFEIKFSGRFRSGSGDEKQTFSITEVRSDVSTPSKLKRSKSMPQLHAYQPYSLDTSHTIKSLFEVDSSHFDVFKLIHGNTLKWYEAEKAVVRAITRSNFKKTLGQQWCFFEKSSIKDLEITFLPLPQVVPQVRKKCKTRLTEEILVYWAKGNQDAPPQPTMLKRDWSALLAKASPARPIVPAQMSKSPDCMFLLPSKPSPHLLCFQVKTGVQDLDVSELAYEISKSPYLAFDDTKTPHHVYRMKNEPKTPITFVYVASVHRKIKEELMKEVDQPNSAVTSTLDHIHVTKGSKALPLPKNVEVIVLLQAGLMALFGKQSYEVLLDPLAEVKAFAEEEATREALKKTSIPLPTTMDQVHEETKKILPVSERC